MLIDFSKNLKKQMNPNTPIEKISRLSEIHKKGLNKLQIKSVLDLILYFPARYSDISTVTNISEIEPGIPITIFGVIKNLKTNKSFHTKVSMAQGVIEDLTGKINLVWFNQPYIAKILKDGDHVMVSGVANIQKNGSFSIANGNIQKQADLPIDIHDSLFQQEKTSNYKFGAPIYKETKGITSLWIQKTLEKVFAEKIHEQIKDPIPEYILKKYSLPDIQKALLWIHRPEKKEHAEAARKRFSFQEIFLIQVARTKEREESKKDGSYCVDTEEKILQEFIDNLPFEPTDAQINAMNSVVEDLKKSYPMSRLLEGDVGSGKTAVAALATYATIKTRPKNQKFGTLQVAYMAPTEILATQHFESFIQFFKGTGIQIALITGSGCRKFPTKVASATKPWTNISRTQLSKWVEQGEISVVVGTHALIQKSVQFKHLALAIVDEQHRFGQKQRRALAKKTSTNSNISPHFLSMTATPIPRTLALTIYGDLDITLLDQLPAGRKIVKTEIITEKTRDEMYCKIKEELKSGRQLYVICPRINDPDEEDEQKVIAKSVETEAKRLKKEIFKEESVGVLHGKMTPVKKDEVMRDFTDGKIQILVATSVVEVGVNVPNANMMIIEGAERFGLAQIHQLRGRTKRGSHQAYCFLLAEAKQQKTVDRLQALVDTDDGFKLAELDLSQRGTGELAGLKQWGVSDIAMEALRNIKLVEAARNEAKAIISEDFELQKNPLLREKIEEIKEMHFE